MDKCIHNINRLAEDIPQILHNGILFRYGQFDPFIGGLMDETRNFSRVSCNEKVIVQFGNNIVDAILTNISLRGALVLFPDDIFMHIGDSFLMTLNLQNSDIVLQFRSEVKHFRKNYAGVKFVYMDVDTFIHLKNLLTARTANPELIRDEFHRFLLSGKSDNR